VLYGCLEGKSQVRTQHRTIYQRQYPLTFGYLWLANQANLSIFIMIQSSVTSGCFPPPVLNLLC